MTDMKASLGGLGISEEQTDMMNVAVSFCRDKSPVAKVRALLEDETGHDPAVWQEIAELGWLGIAIPEDYDGVGLGLAEVVPVAEQMGRTLMAGPFIASTIVAQALLAGGSEQLKQMALPQIAGGKTAALAMNEDSADYDLTNISSTATADGDTMKLSGTKTLVTDADKAGFILASLKFEGAPALALIDASSISPSAMRRETVIDETRRSFEVTLDGVEVPARQLITGEAAQTALTQIDLAANLLLTAEMVGGAQACIDYTVDYLNTRTQFGKKIGSYQSLKHVVVDAYVDYEKARSHLYSAAWEFGNQGRGEVAVRMAKAQADKAYSFAADRAIQFHGGFGFTYDCDAQLYRRRAIWNASQFGDANWQKKKLAKLLLS